ncbi:MAG: hypothetical protein MUF29_09155 [Chitinophagaceae bacterium]|nr:hypothetical protein [Chitinophagaceae bacterium]
MKTEKLFCMVLGLCLLLAGAAQVGDASASENAFRKRAQLLMIHVAYHYPVNKPGFPPGWDGKLDDFGKYNYPLFTAWLSLQDKDSARQRILQERMKMYAQRPTFHFNLVGLPRLLYLHGQHPAIRENALAFLQRVWERTDSYNAFTAEGTENHISMSKTSGYLYAQFAQEHFAGRFPDASARLKQMKQWVLDWARRIFYAGTGEFNSAIYQAYHIIGWLNLYDFARDAEVKAAARAVLDYYSSEMALHYVQAMSGGSDLRGQNCTRSFAGSYAYLAWLWFGDSPAPVTADGLAFERGNNEMIQSVHAATSTYRPPALAMALARQKFETPSSFVGSKPAYLLDRQGYIKQTLYASKSFLLGAGYFPYGGWGSGNNQVVSWKLIARVDSGAGKSAQYVSGIGIQNPRDRRYAGGNKRSPYDQLVHHENVLIQLTRLPKHAAQQKDSIKNLFNMWRQRWAADFSKRFPSDTGKLSHNPIYINDLDVSVNRSAICVANHGFLKEITEEGILFLELEQVFLAIRSVRGDVPKPLQDDEGGEMLFTTVQAPAGEVCGLILEVAERKGYPGFDEFRQSYKAKTKLDNSRLTASMRLTYTSVKGDQITVQYQPDGTFTEPMFDFGYGVTQPAVILQSKTWQQPAWPSGEGHGRLARWWVNGLEVDMETYWPVYSGPGLFIGKGRLQLTGRGKEEYQVDFTGRIPVFTETKSRE